MAGRLSSFALEAPIAGLPRARVSDLELGVVFAPAQTHASRASDLVLEVVYAEHPFPLPRTSDLALEVVYSTALPYQARSIAWTFSLDGHTFYVLDLGEQGTFLFDLDTQSWCEFQTQNSVGWNLRNGTMWYANGAPRIVGADSLYPYVWELDPTQMFDDGFRDIEHAATTGIALRSRIFLSLSELRIATSAGLVDDTTGAAYMQLTYSDDGGQTYSDPIILMLTTGDTPAGPQQDIRFPSLGAFMAPGRVLQISDVGGVLRIDGADAMLDGYDGAGEQTADE